MKRLKVQYKCILQEKKIVFLLLVFVLCFSLMGCGVEDSKEQTKENVTQLSSEYQSEEEKERQFSDLYNTQELCIEGLGDIEFKVPKSFLENKKEEGEWNYYYYNDLMLATNISEESTMTNETFVEEGMNSFIEGLLSDGNGKLISKDVIELAIGKIARVCTEQTINGEKYVMDFAAFCYESNLYNLGFARGKNSEWDYSKDFDCLIESITGRKEAACAGSDVQQYLDDFPGLKNWFNENSEEMIYFDYKKEENRETYKTSTGVVSNVFKPVGWIDFIQRNEEGYFEQGADVEETILTSVNELDDFQTGDGIKLYYYIDSQNEVELFAVEKIEPEFTFEDYANGYREQCVEYTYEDIARNPESVKGSYARLTGEVIQVLESGSEVQMRVNITRDEYGYYSDTIFVAYTRKSDMEDRILEGDIISIYGQLYGLVSYKSVSGAEITLPQIYAKYIDIQRE